MHIQAFPFTNGYKRLQTIIIGYKRLQTALNVYSTDKGHQGIYFVVQKAYVLSST